MGGEGSVGTDIGEEWAENLLVGDEGEDLAKVVLGFLLFVNCARLETDISAAVEDARIKGEEERMVVECVVPDLQLNAGVVLVLGRSVFRFSNMTGIEFILASPVINSRYTVASEGLSLDTSMNTSKV